MQPSSEAYEVEDRCFRVSVARRLMLPHPAAANPADVVQFCPKKVRQVLFATNLSIPKQQSLLWLSIWTVDMQHWCDADIIQSHSGVKRFIEQEEPALTRVVNGQTEHARMDSVFNLLLSLAVRP